MNTLVMLFVTTCVPAADPAMGFGAASARQAIPGTTADCGCNQRSSVIAHETRTGFFSRIRGFFGRWSHGNDHAPVPMGRAYQENATSYPMGIASEPPLAPPIATSPAVLPPAIDSVKEIASGAEAAGRSGATVNVRQAFARARKQLGLAFVPEGRYTPHLSTTPAHDKSSARSLTTSFNLVAVIVELAMA